MTKIRKYRSLGKLSDNATIKLKANHSRKQRLTLNMLKQQKQNLAAHMI
jgi:hypothetical protein